MKPEPKPGHSSVLAAGGGRTPDDFPSLRAYWDYNDQFAIDYRTADEKAALEAMYSQYAKLRELGWADASYCPKDGSQFLAITAGSTGIFLCHYDGEWPKGTWWIIDGGDRWPARPILWKQLPGKREDENLTAWWFVGWDRLREKTHKHSERKPKIMRRTDQAHRRWKNSLPPK